jgi:putative membrane protein
MKAIAPLLFFVTLFLFSSCSKNKPDDSKEVAEEQNEEKFDTTNLEYDTEFAVSAADAGILEVQVGTLALTKATNSIVKQFAQTMIDDHTKANEELKALAQSKNITLPAILSAKHQKELNDLAEKSGSDFDKEYSDLMVKDHKDVVDMFKKAADKCNDAELKAWAAAKISALEHHLSMAENVKEQVK